MREGRCRECGDAVIWCERDSGSLVPLDASPVPDGDFVIEETGKRPLARRFKRLFDDPSLDRYASHLDRCRYRGKPRRE